MDSRIIILIRIDVLIRLRHYQLYCKLSLATDNAKLLTPNSNFIGKTAYTTAISPLMKVQTTHKGTGSEQRLIDNDFFNAISLHY
jgi:hypothetical protein